MARRLSPYSFGGRRPGLVYTDPAGEQAILPFLTGELGPISGNSVIVVQPDGTVIVTSITTIIEMAVEAAGAGGHLHGLQRMLGDGATTTFNLLDIAEYLEHVGVNGAFLDPLTFTLSANRGQIIFDTAPGAGQVITLEYVIAGV